ncbi:hypothetical protein GUITHDRAFT_81756 [Guillardia theta CCMP2712]|uniref:RING-type E3 ubiquitin transferase n=2 Tax=Guillardia theta TaxID=55529 RepID=L1IAK2_GUITC|nr:hypothetical protein GUITHDRAFT_81756 [Guillardia theta CCMP2712]EKX33137.1 hypothetical protein GUITHDRAFT_81756 [Guillardia theta CCMP2712]|eukprot:XP_005820117.1 hypothetical protein GUITHDRAFT_81756 [Guillardia theta CCMP2712]
MDDSVKEGAGKAPARSASASAGESEGQSRFICHICLNSPDKPIATVCGHLYCWGCIYKWLMLHRDDSQCPVCKAGIEIPGGDVSKAKVIPLYVGETSQTDPRNCIPEDPSIPQRPAGERPEPQRSGFFQGWQGTFTPGNGYPQIVTNVGLFPSLFGLAFVCDL